MEKITLTQAYKSKSYMYYEANIKMGFQQQVKRLKKQTGNDLEIIVDSEIKDGDLGLGGWDNNIYEFKNNKWELIQDIDTLTYIPFIRDYFRKKHGNFNWTVSFRHNTLEHQNELKTLFNFLGLTTKCTYEKIYVSGENAFDLFVCMNMGYSDRMVIIQKREVNDDVVAYKNNKYIQCALNKLDPQSQCDWVQTFGFLVEFKDEQKEKLLEALSFFKHINFSEESDGIYVEGFYQDDCVMIVNICEQIASE